MVVGHTRCVVDGCFGLIKKHYRQNDCKCLSHISQVIRNSAICNIPQLLNGWKWYEWDKCLAQYFKPIPGIRKIRRFHFSLQFPGIVFVKRSSIEPEEQIDILRCPSSEVPSHHPSILNPAGIMNERAIFV